MVVGRSPRCVRDVGYDYVHSVIDDYSRLAYSEIHPDERGRDLRRLPRRAPAWFLEHGIIASG